MTPTTDDDEEEAQIMAAETTNVRRQDASLLTDETIAAVYDAAELYQEDASSSNVEGYSTHDEDEEETTAASLTHQEGRSLASTTTSSDDDDDSSTTTDEGSRGQDYHAMYLARAEFLNAVGNPNNTDTNHNHHHETDLELGRGVADLLDDDDDDSSADNSIVSQNNNRNNNRTENDTEDATVVTRTCGTRACQGTKNILYVVLFPILIVTSVAVPLVIVMLCFVLMFIALVVLLCIYYCCARRGEQGPIPFHVLIRQLLEAVEDDGTGGDPASSDTPKYAKEEIQNALVRRKVVEFRVMDPATGTVVEDVELTDEATREDRLHQDMFPIIHPTEVLNDIVGKEEEEGDDDDDEEANKKNGRLKKFRKRMSSRRKRKASKKKVEDEVEYNNTYELRMNPGTLTFQTNPAASHSKFYLMKRTYVFSAPLEPEKIRPGPDSSPDIFNDGGGNANVDAYDAEANGAINYLSFDDGDSSSSSSGFFPVIPSSSSSSSSSSGDSSAQSSSSESFLIDDTTANNPPYQDTPNNEDDGHEQAQEIRAHDTIYSEGDGIPSPAEGSTDGVHTTVELEADKDGVLDIETGPKDNLESPVNVEDPCETSSHTSILNRAPATKDVEKGASVAVPPTDIADGEDEAASDVSQVEPSKHREEDLNSSFDNTDAHLSIVDDMQTSPELLEENRTGESIVTTASSEEVNQPGLSDLPVPTMENTHGNCPATIAASAGELNSPSSQSQPTEPEHRGISSYCNICLLEYEVGDIVVWSRRPDGCHHAWHEDCLLDWLKRKPSCPNCRQIYFAVEDAPGHVAAAPVGTDIIAPEIEIDDEEMRRRYSIPTDVPIWTDPVARDPMFMPPA